MSEFFTAAEMDELNRELYPAGATLKLFEATPGAAPTLLATVTSGFYCQRNSQKQDAAHNQQTRIWLTRSALTNEAHLHNASAVEFTARGQTLRYELVEVIPFQQIGAGWILTLGQSTSSALNEVG